MAGNSAVEAGRAMISVRVKENVREGLQAAAQKLDEFADRTKKTTATVTETSRQITQGMSSRLASLGGGFEAVGLRIGLIGAGLTGAAASVLSPLKSMVTGFAQTGNVIQKFAARAGTSTEAISRLTYAAEISGASATELQNQFRRMQDVITTATTNPNMQAGFAQIGLNLQALAGMKPEEQFRTIAEAISRLQNPALKTAAAVDIFGEGANRLLPLLNEGAAGIDRMSAEADRLNLTMSQDAGNSAAALTDAMDQLKWSVQAAKNRIAAALAPAVIFVAQKLSMFAAATSRFVQNNQGLVRAVAIAAIAVGVLGAALTATGTIVAAIGATLISLSAIGTVLAPVFAAIGSAISFIISPFGLAIAAVVALAGAFLYFSGYGKKLVTFLYTQLSAAVAFVRKVFGGIYDAIMAGDLKLAFQIVWAGAKVVWFTAVEMLQTAWTDFTNWLWLSFGTIGDFFYQCGAEAWKMTRSVMDAIFPLNDALVGAFVDAAGPILDAIGLIGNALAKGEIVAAGQIAMLSLQMAWSAGIGRLQTEWAEFTSWLSGGWDLLVVGMQSVWNTLITFFAKSILAMLESWHMMATAVAKFDPTGAAQAVADMIGGNMAAARQSLDEDAARKQDQLNAGYASRAMAREKALSDLRAKNAAELAELQRKRQEIVDRIGAGEGLTLASSKEELDKLIAEAERRRKAAEEAARNRGKDGVGGGIGAMQAAADRGRSATTAGTFARGAAAFQALAAGGVNKQQMAMDAIGKATKGTEENTAEMLRLMTRKSPGEIDEPEAALAFSQ